MRFLIFGAGAIGSVHGAFLRKAGHEVVLYGRPERMRAIAEKGLAIDGIWGEFHLPEVAVRESIRDLEGEEFDVILFCVRAYDTFEAGSQAARLCGNRTLFVAMQNGLGNWEILSQFIPTDRLALARVIFGAKTPEPHRATVTVIADPTRIGNPTGELSPQCLSELAATIRESGIPTEATDRVMAFIWGKVFYNSALNPLSALRNLTYGELADDPGIRSIMNRVIEEAFEVARAESAPLLWETAEDYLRAFYELEVPPTRDHRSSMLQAIERGKRTEIESLNGEIVRRGDRHGIPVEANRELVRLLHEKEREVTG